MLNETTIYDLSELANAVGVTTRTIRYYVSQGLIPSPATRGPGTRYDRGHLDRLQLIRRLQRQHFPLAEIRKQLESLDDAGVRQVLRSAPEPPKQSSALSYVRDLLGKATEKSGNLPTQPLAHLRQSDPEPAPHFFRESMSATMRPVSASPASPASPASSASAAPTPLSRPAGRSTWDHVALSRDVELHVRRPLTREQNRQVEQLMEAARHIFT